MHRALQLAAVGVALLAFDLLQTPLPPRCRDPVRTRLLLYITKRLLYGKVKSFSGLESNIPPLGFMFDADVK